MADGRRRNRTETEHRLVEAVGVVLARDGFRALGVNKVADEAGVDKVLIYRYFDGLPGLLRAFGESGSFWPSDDEVLSAAGSEADPPDQRWAGAVIGAMRGIRSRPLTHEILAWEVTERNELTAELEAVRERQFERLADLIGVDVDSAPHFRAGVVLAIAATNYLLARARTISVFAGADLHDDATWAILEDSVSALFRSASATPSLITPSPARDSPVRRQ